MEPITSFSGEFSFLSNFSPVVITFEGVTYPSVEHGFQASKTVIQSERVRISKLLTPGKSKREGRKLELRPDWEEVKIPIMEELLILKFSKPRFKERLLSTTGRELVEGNNWGDTFWGVCQGEGRNELGKLLMKIRQKGE